MWTEAGSPLLVHSEALRASYSKCLPLLTSGWLAPIGLSYYTFKLLSYVLDVYWGKMRAEKDWTAVAELPWVQAVLERFQRSVLIAVVAMERNGEGGGDALPGVVDRQVSQQAGMAPAEPRVPRLDGGRAALSRVEQLQVQGRRESGVVEHRLGRPHRVWLVR